MLFIQEVRPQLVVNLPRRSMSLESLERPHATNALEPRLFFVFHDIQLRNYLLYSSIACFHKLRHLFKSWLDFIILYYFSIQL